MDRSSSVGRRIRSARTAGGLTQAALAERLGLTAKTVWRWEGARSSPNRRHAAALAEILGGRPDDY